MFRDSGLGAPRCRGEHEWLGLHGGVVCRGGKVADDRGKEEADEEGKQQG